MVINFENAASHKYVVHAAKILCMARSEMSVCLFLVLSKYRISSVSKIPFANNLVVTPQIHFGHAMAGVWPLIFQLCIVCGFNFS